MDALSVAELKTLIANAGLTADGCIERSDLVVRAREAASVGADRVGRSRVRLWAVSDIHTDCPENEEWVARLDCEEFQNDALIVAGDVSESVSVVEATLKVLASKFNQVFFVPGNHDLWISEEDTCDDSLTKLHGLLALCARLGICTHPAKIGEASVEGGTVWVCPLLSWHHQTFDTEPEVEGWAVPSAAQTMTDYRACRFPSPLSQLDDSVARAVDELNAARVEHMLLERAPRPAEPLVTFSHFLPRLDLLPEKRFLMVPELPKAAGSTFLRRRLHSLMPSVHVFGHTHFAWVRWHGSSPMHQLLEPSLILPPPPP